MPVARYFLFIGGILLALIFAIDGFSSPQVVVASRAASSVDKTVVRIRSDQKLPERVVYDTSLPTIGPAPVMAAQAVAPPAAAPTGASATDSGAQARARDTFAQFVPAEAKPEPQVQRKRKIAKSRPARPMQTAQQPQLRVAQQSQFGFFGGSNWNSTW